ncbi:MAG: fatty acid desaturase, partial [Nanoarchaeota archaeon]
MDMDYITLRKQVIDAGLLKRQYGYYAFKYLTTAAMLSLSILILIRVENFGLQLLNSVFLAFVFVQFGLLMHDADHQQVFNSRLMNELAGVLAGNLVVNISSGGWTEKHNKHHSTPNLEGHDEDIDVPIMAYSEEQAMKKKWLAILIVKH